MRTLAYPSVPVFLLIVVLIVPFWYLCQTHFLNEYSGCFKAATRKVLYENVPKKNLTFRCSSGELGNRMMYYAVVYGISRLNNRNGYIQECNIQTCRYTVENCQLNRLDETFLLTLPVGPNLPNEQQKGHIINFHSKFPDDFRIPDDANILVGEEYPVSVTHFLHVRDEIRHEFQFKKPFVTYSQEILVLARGNRKTATFVGVHIRRTTYLPHLQFFKVSQAPQEFYDFALRYFRRRFSDVVFVVMSDDLEWCRGNITGPDVFVPAKGSTPENDLAVLSHCNHSVFDYGTFGFWGAFLAGGDTLYYTDGIVDTQLRDSIKGKVMYPPEWTGISSAMLKTMEAG